MKKCIVHTRPTRQTSTLSFQLSPFSFLRRKPPLGSSLRYDPSHPVADMQWHRRLAGEMADSPCSGQSTAAARTGFTLVEMLVAVTLVLLMMLMFGQIFELATGSLSQQQGLADNDQRARTLQTILRSDIDKRTYRILVPFYPGEEAGIPDELIQAQIDQMRDGYLYISENNPNNDTDDVLQFTVWSGHPDSQGEDTSPYFGKSSPLTNDENGLGYDVNQDGSLSAAERQLDEFSINVNQPEHDNGSLYPDQTASSPYAEVSYFLRGGNLYRRVLLIRDPLKSGTTALSAQPEKEFYWDTMNSRWAQFTPPLNFMDGVNSSAANPSGLGLYPDVGPDMIPYSGDEVNTGDFWHDFDYSAHRSSVNGNFTDPVDYAIFHSVSDLDNSQVPAPDTRLARPNNRFGHDHWWGHPREYLYHPGSDGRPGTGDDVKNAAFIGRFTRAETSHPYFNYPQFLSVNEGPTGMGAPPFFPGNPPDPVHGINDGNPMRIDWPGPARDIQRLPLYLSGGVAVASWGGDGDPGVANFDDNGDGVIDNAEEAGWPGSDDIGFRTPRRRSEDVILPNVQAFNIEVWDEALNQFVDIGHSRSVGFFRQTASWHLSTIPGPMTPVMSPLTYGPHPPGPTVFNNRIFDTWHNAQVDANSDGAHDQPPFRPMKYSPITATPWAPLVGIWQPNTGYNVGDLVFPNPTDTTQPPHWRNGFQYVFRCIQAGNSGTTGSMAAPSPPWSSAGNVSDGGVIWQPIRNEPLPLRAIRITIRFRDSASGQVRQTSIVESLIDDAGNN